MNTTGIYIARGDDTLGPYTSSEAAKLIKSGELAPNDHAARSGDAEWVMLSTFLPSEPPPGPAPVPEARAGVPVPPTPPTASTASTASTARTPAPDPRAATIPPSLEIRPARPAPAPEIRATQPTSFRESRGVTPAETSGLRAAKPVSPPAPEAARHVHAPGTPGLEIRPASPEQNSGWLKWFALSGLGVALLATGLLMTADRWSHEAAPGSVAKTRRLSSPAVPAAHSPAGGVPGTTAPISSPAPVAKTTPRPVAPKESASAVAQTAPVSHPPGPTAPPAAPAQATPAPSPQGRVVGVMPAPVLSSETPALIGQATPAPGVPGPALPPPENAGAPPVEKGRPLRGAVSLDFPGGLPVTFSHVRVSAYPLAALTAALASRQAQVDAELARLAPQIQAAESEKATRAAAERAAQRELLDAPLGKFRAALRFAYEQAKTAVKAAETDYHYLLDERREVMDGSGFFRDLPPAAATTETDLAGEFTLDLPPGGPFAVAVSASRTTAEGARTYYWLVKVPTSGDGGNVFLLSNANVASSGSPDSLIRTAD